MIGRMVWSPTIIQQLCVFKYILSLKYEGKKGNLILEVAVLR